MRQNAPASARRSRASPRRKEAGSRRRGRNDRKARGHCHSAHGSPSAVAATHDSDSAAGKNRCRRTTPWRRFRAPIKATMHGHPPFRLRRRGGGSFLHRWPGRLRRRRAPCRRRHRRPPWSRHRMEARPGIPLTPSADAGRGQITPLLARRRRTAGGGEGCNVPSSRATRKRLRKRRIVGIVAFYTSFLSRCCRCLYFAARCTSASETRVEGQVIPPAGMLSWPTRSGS